MNPPVIFQLLARRSVAVTALCLAAAGAMLIGAERYLRDPAYAEVHAALNFVLICLVATFGVLISLGGLVGHAMHELEELPASRLVPGLARRTKTSVRLLIPLVTLLATGFLYLAIPSAGETIGLPLLLLLNAFWFCLGIGLGWSWLKFAVIIAVFVKSPKIILAVQTHPVWSALVLFTAIDVLLLVHARRFTRPGTSRWFAWLSLPSFAGAGAQRRDRAYDPVANADVSLTGSIRHKLYVAAFHERFGARRAAILGPILVSVLAVQGFFAFFVQMPHKQHAAHFGQFVASVFTADHPTSQVFFLRYAFAIGLACVGYVFALTYHAAPAPNIWHPVSRRARSDVVFLTHLTVNVLFAVAQALAVLAAVGLAAVLAHVPIGAHAVLTFLLPVATTLLLQPLAQAIFASHDLKFQQSGNSAVQLAAGALGAVFCLLTVYWSNQWPTRALHAVWSLPAQLLLLGTAVLAVYGGYYVYLRWRYARCDLRPRLG